MFKKFIYDYSYCTRGTISHSQLLAPSLFFRAKTHSYALRKSEEV